VTTDSLALALRPQTRVRLNTGGDGPTAFHYYADKVINEDGSFELRDVLPGEYRVVVAPMPPNAYLKEVRFGGVDVLGGAFRLAGVEMDRLDIVVGGQPAQLDGVVTDERLQPAANVRVVLVPDHRERSDLFKTTMTDASGRFRLSGLAPGDYKLFAWEAIELNSWFDPEVLKQFDRKGTPVRLNESGQQNVNLLVITGGSR